MGAPFNLQPNIYEWGVMEMERQCPGCGGSIEPRQNERNPRKWCSESCRVRAYRKRKPEVVSRHREEAIARTAIRSAARRAEREKIPCPNCGKEFTPWAKRKFCSDQCSGLHHAHKRRAWMLSVEYEDVSRASIFERDEWVCGLCATPIDPSLAFPDRGAATLDHITPVSLGGGHTESNLQASHFGCNSSKQNREAVSDGYSRTRAEAY